MIEEFEFDKEDELSLLETLDHVLDKGLVIAGDIVISVADIDLIYVGLNVLLGSVETVNEVLGRRVIAVPTTEGRASLASSGAEGEDARADEADGGGGG